MSEVQKSSPSALTCGCRLCTTTLEPRAVPSMQSLETPRGKRRETRRGRAGWRNKSDEQRRRREASEVCSRPPGLHEAAAPPQATGSLSLVKNSPLPVGQSFSSHFGRFRGGQPRSATQAQEAAALAEEALCFFVKAADRDKTMRPKFEDVMLEDPRKRAGPLEKTRGGWTAAPRQRGGSAGAVPETTEIGTEEKRGVRAGVQPDSDIRAQSTCLSVPVTQKRGPCRRGWKTCSRQLWHKAQRRKPEGGRGVGQHVGTANFLPTVSRTRKLSSDVSLDVELAALVSSVETSCLVLFDLFFGAADAQNLTFKLGLHELPLSLHQEFVCPLLYKVATATCGNEVGSWRGYVGPAGLHWTSALDGWCGRLFFFAWTSIVSYSSGGNSRFCVRECRQLAPLHWRCHEFGGVRVFGCQGPRSLCVRNRLPLHSANAVLDCEEQVVGHCGRRRLHSFGHVGEKCGVADDATVSGVTLDMSKAEALKEVAMQEVQDDLDRHASLDYGPFDSAVKTTQSHVKEHANPEASFRVKRSAPHIVAACCHTHAESKADMDAQVLSCVERWIRCLGIASSNASCYRVVTATVDPWQRPLDFRGAVADLQWAPGRLFLARRARRHRPQRKRCDSRRHFCATPESDGCMVDPPSVLTSILERCSVGAVVRVSKQRIILSLAKDRGSSEAFSFWFGYPDWVQEVKVDKTGSCLGFQTARRTSHVSHTPTLFRVWLKRSFTLRSLHCFASFLEIVILIGTVHVARAVYMA